MARFSDLLVKASIARRMGKLGYHRIPKQRQGSKPGWRKWVGGKFGWDYKYDHELSKPKQTDLFGKPEATPQPVVNEAAPDVYLGPYKGKSAIYTAPNGKTYNVEILSEPNSKGDVRLIITDTGLKGKHSIDNLSVLPDPVVTPTGPQKGRTAIYAPGKHRHEVEIMTEPNAEGKVVVRGRAGQDASVLLSDLEFVEETPEEVEKPQTLMQRLTSFVESLATPAPVRVAADIYEFVQKSNDVKFLRALAFTLRSRFAREAEKEQPSIEEPPDEDEAPADKEPKEKEPKEKEPKEKEPKEKKEPKDFTLRQLLKMVEARLAELEPEELTEQQAAAPEPVEPPAPVSEPDTPAIESTSFDPKEVMDSILTAMTEETLYQSSAQVNDLENFKIQFRRDIRARFFDVFASWLEANRDREGFSVPPNTQQYVDEMLADDKVLDILATGLYRELSRPEEPALEPAPVKPAPAKAAPKVEVGKVTFDKMTTYEGVQESFMVVDGENVGSISREKPTETSPGAYRRQRAVPGSEWVYSVEVNDKMLDIEAGTSLREVKKKMIAAYRESVEASAPPAVEPEAPVTTFEQRVKDVSSFEDFKSLYEETLSRMMGYSPGQAGSKVSAEKLALLTESYPHFESRYDKEAEPSPTPAPAKAAPEAVAAPKLDPEAPRALVPRKLRDITDKEEVKALRKLARTIGKKHGFMIRVRTGKGSMRGTVSFGATPTPENDDARKELQSALLALGYASSNERAAPSMTLESEKEQYDRSGWASIAFSVTGRADYPFQRKDSPVEDYIQGIAQKDVTPPAIEAEVSEEEMVAAHKTRLAALGPQFFNMVKVKSGAYDHAKNRSTVSFANPNRGKPNYVQITYNPGKDSYNVRFGRKVMRNGVMEFIDGISYMGVLVGNVKELFERETGLALSVAVSFAPPPAPSRHEDKAEVRNKELERPEATTPQTAPVEFTSEGELRAQAVEETVGDYEANQQVTDAMATYRTIGQRKEANARALEIAYEAVSSGRVLTDEERVEVAKYSGEGGVGADLNQFHTRPDIAEAMWELVKSYSDIDVKRGLEPAAGSGVFLQVRPPDVSVDAVEMSKDSATVCTALHASSDVVNQSFEEFAVDRVGQEPQYDTVITNAPFVTRADKTARYHKPQIKSADHYFIDTALDQCREGGIVSMIVHSSVMGHRTSEAKAFRERILARAEVVDAYRLPGAAFEHTHTSVVSDVVFLRKRPEMVGQALLEAQRAGDLEGVMGAHGAYDKSLVDGTFFDDAHPDRVLGKAMSADETGYRAEVRGDAEVVADKMRKLSQTPLENKEITMEMLTDLAERNEKVDRYINRAKVVLTESGPPSIGEVRVIGSFKYTFIGDPPSWQRIDNVSIQQVVQNTESAAIHQANDLADRIKHLKEAAESGDYYKARGLRRELQKDVLAWVDEFGIPGTHKELMRLAESAPDLLFLAGAVTSDGGLSDLLSKDRAIKVKDELDRTNLEEVANHIAMRNGGFVNLGDIQANWTGGTGFTNNEKEIRRHILLTGKFAYVGEGRYQHYEDYLTGELYTKLEAERTRLADAVEGWEREALEEQVGMLEERIKARRKPIDEVQLNLRTVRWLPTEVLTDWIRSEGRQYVGFGRGEYDRRYAEGLTLEYIDNVYVLTHGGEIVQGPEGSALLKYMNRAGRLRREVIDEFNNIVNREFTAWLVGSEHAGEVEELYNRTFLSRFEKKYSGAPLGFDYAEFDSEGNMVKPGLGYRRVRDQFAEDLKNKAKEERRPLTPTEMMAIERHKVIDTSKPIVPRDYQNEAIRWANETGRGVIALDVGLGKTFVGILLARLRKQQRKARRPLMVVPKSVVANWVDETEALTPGSRIMVLGESKKILKRAQKVVDKAAAQGRELTEEERQFVDANTRYVRDTPEELNAKLAQVQQNEYDMIITSHEVLADIPMKEATTERYADEAFFLQKKQKLAELSEKKSTTKEKQTKKLRESFMASIRGVEKPGRGNVYWEDLGIDMMVVDEAHEFKNLEAVGNGFAGGTAKFMGGSSTSVRSQRMWARSKYLREQNNDLGMYFLTATPVKNSPIEIYNMLAYIAPERLKKLGVENVDDFVERHCVMEDRLVMNHNTYQLEEKNCVVGFQNIDELRGLMDELMMFRTAPDVSLEIPEAKDELVALEKSAEQDQLFDEIASEAENADEDKPGKVFALMHAKDKAGMAPELYDPETYAGTFAESPKIKACVDRILDGYEARGGQLVFSDLGLEVHTRLKEALVERGIPESEIEILNASTAKSSADRQAIGDRFNLGVTRVVIGNRTMGQGVNLQGKDHDLGTTDIHHLDVAWDPGTMHQRNGRAVRQGNPAKEVNIHTYALRQSQDAYRYQTVAGKDTWLQKIRSGSDFVDTGALSGATSMDEQMAFLTGVDDEEGAERLAQLYRNAENKQRQKILDRALRDWSAMQTAIKKIQSTKNEDKRQEMLQNLERRKRRLARVDVLPQNIRDYIESSDENTQPAIAFTNMNQDTGEIDSMLVAVGDVWKLKDYQGYEQDMIIEEVNPRTGEMKLRRFGGRGTYYVNDPKKPSSSRLSVSSFEEGTRTELTAMDEVKQLLGESGTGYSGPLEDVQNQPLSVLEQHRSEIQQSIRGYLRREAAKPYTKVASVYVQTPDGKVMLADGASVLSSEDRAEKFKGMVKQYEQNMNYYRTSAGEDSYMFREQKAKLDAVLENIAKLKDGPLVDSRILVPAFGDDAELIMDYAIQNSTTDRKFAQIMDTVRTYVNNLEGRSYNDSRSPRFLTLAKEAQARHKARKGEGAA